MAEIHRSVASLRIFGDSLNPDEISRILNCQPSRSGIKGRPRSETRKDILWKSGAWFLEASPAQPEDLNAQIKEIFSRITTDPTVWAQLSKDYQIDLFCGFFMNETEEGFEIAPETMKILSDRGIKVGICIYAPIE